MNKLLLLPIMAVILVAGCVSQLGGGTTKGTASTIEIKGYAFDPSTITIARGTTVIWTNLDPTTHTVTSDSGSELDSGVITSGQNYSHTFNTAGTFTYHCSIHINMKGTIIVT